MDQNARRRTVPATWLLGLVLLAVGPGQAATLCSTDIDGDGQSDPATDGILLARYLAGRRGEALIQGALGPGARTDAESIAASRDVYGGPRAEVVNRSLPPGETVSLPSNLGQVDFSSVASRRE